ncbi:hypothetical protein [Moorena producens]|uniref:hypothetical protein n=1 Tax=Moorena producens TaxID=1155739 RepID=UPI003C718C14
MTCSTRPEPGKIEVSSPQAYLVYDAGFGVPHRTLSAMQSASGGNPQDRNGALSASNY